MPLLIGLGEGDSSVEINRLVKLNINFEALGEPGCVKVVLLG